MKSINKKKSYSRVGFIGGVIFYSLIISFILSYIFLPRNITGLISSILLTIGKIILTIIGIFILLLVLIKIKDIWTTKKISNKIKKILDREPFPLNKYLIKFSFFGEEGSLELNFKKIYHDLIYLSKNEKIIILDKIQSDIELIKELVGKNENRDASLTLPSTNELEAKKDIKKIKEVEGLFYIFKKLAEENDILTDTEFDELLKPKLKV